MFNTTTTNRPVTATAKVAVSGTELVSAAYAGTVRFSKVRENGSLRHWPVLAPKSTERKQAEKWNAAITGGSSVAKEASASKVSVATLRRALVALKFTEELEGLNKTNLAKAAKEVSIVAAKPKVEKTTKAPAKAPAKAKVSTAKLGDALGDLIQPKGKPSVKEQAKAHAAKNSTIKATVTAVTGK